MGLDRDGQNMTTLPNMGLVLATPGGTTGTWGTVVNNAFGLLDTHNHTAGLGVKVPTAGLNIDADLTFSSLYAPTNLHRLSFAAVAALAANNKSLFVSSADSELYWRSNAGTNVKMTAGSALNVAAFAGGFSGDYSAVGAVAAFDDAGDRYTFKQQTPFNWARMASGEVRIFETGTTESVFVGLAAPAALAVSYTMTWPTAAPGSTAIAQIDNAGQWSFSNTVANALVLSSSLTVGTSLAVGTSATVGTTLGVTGLITATAGLTAAVNQHLTVSGTGEFKHGALTMTIAPVAADVGGGTTATRQTNGTGWDFGASTQPVLYPIPLNVGDRITGWKVYMNKTTNAGNTDTAQLKKYSPTTGTYSNVGSAATNAANAPGFISLSITGLTASLVAGDSYVIDVRSAGASSGDSTLSAEVTWDRP